ncbi:hypothetical protein MMPV_001102 [Pyropia vietnamensis]
MATAEAQDKPQARMLDWQYQLIRSFFQYHENMQAAVLLAYDHLGKNNQGMYVAIKGVVDIFATLPKAKRVLRELKFSVRLSGHPDLMFLENLLVPSDEKTFNGIFMVFKLMRCNLAARLAEGVAVAQAEAYGIAHNLGKGCGQRVGKPITGRQVKRWMFELLTGLAFMHGSGVLHRDIKPTNLLVDDEDRLRICDMGLARADIRRGEDFPYLWTSHVVSRSYRAPELFLRRDLTPDATDKVSPPSSPQPAFSDASPSSVVPDIPIVSGTPPSNYPPFSSYSPAIDVWSAGAVFAETLTGRVLIPGRLPVKEQLYAVLRFSGTPKNPDWFEGGGLSTPTMKRYLKSLPFFPGMDKSGCFPGVSFEGTHLLGQLLAFDPRDRPTAAEALRHPYFNSVRDEYAGRPRPVALNPADFEFETRQPSADELPRLRREIVQEIKEFRQRNGKGQGGLGASPHAFREPLPSALSMPAPRTHDGEVAQEAMDQRVFRGVLTLPAQLDAVRLDSNPPSPR